ncbi:hypothetical protein WQ57_21170 [Mesobacillus campisalis]|uniref:Uncharacterized protein n=1 Tax=Mesobacillus campisalis TaxID=1408103 RepID=A0A0M2SR26_9BACI|nr:hypothetical protein WQ57_21170 [Mesobacillus campisalis]
MVLNKDNAKTEMFNQKREGVYDKVYDLKQKDDNVTSLSSAAAKSSAKISAKRSDTMISE